MPNQAQIQEAVRTYILEQFLPGEDPENLQPTTELATSGILDSIGTLQLVAFLEERFGITVEAHEADVHNLNSVESITALVHSKESD